jgi:hypothetical protein
MTDDIDIETAATDIQGEAEDWLSRHLDCELDWTRDKYARFDFILYGRGAYPQHFAYAEVKGRSITKDRYNTFRLTINKLESARSIWQTEKAPCYLIVVWTDVIGLLDLTKLTDDQLTFGSGWISDPMRGRVIAEAVYIPISLFETCPRGAYQP